MDIQNLSPEMCIHHLKQRYMHMHTHTYTHIFKREDGGWKGNQDRADSPITRIHEIMIWSIEKSMILKSIDFQVPISQP